MVRRRPGWRTLVRRLPGARSPACSGRSRSADALSAQRFDLRGTLGTLATEAPGDFDLGLGFGPGFNLALETFFDARLPRLPLRFPGLIYASGSAGVSVAAFAAGSCSCCSSCSSAGMTGGFGTFIV